MAQAQSTATIPAFHILAKPIGPICNLDCEYCFYLEKENLYPSQKSFHMSYEVLENFIRQEIETHPNPQVDFAWQGGEPTLLGIAYFKDIVKLQNKHAGGKHITNAFQTNGVLLDDPWCRFLKENDFLVGLSIDGPEEMHNHYRKFKGGQDSFMEVMAGIELLKKHAVEFNTLTVIQKHNSQYPLEVYHFLKEIGSGFMQFIPIVEQIASATPADGLSLVSPDAQVESTVSEWSVAADQFGQFLIDIFDEWVRNDVGQYYVQIFDISLESWLGREPSLCIFREKCGTALALEHNGDLYSCDHYVYPENRLGNIMESSLAELITSPQQQKFGQDKLDRLPQYCLDCEVRFACNGECPKNRIIKTPDGEAGLNYLCSGYRRFFNHIAPFMRFMAQQLQNRLPPAAVKEWAVEKDLGFPALGAQRNDDCPCGSGLKFKKCCMV